MTRDLGVSLAKSGIRVNAVCPGFVYTRLTQGITEDPEKRAMVERMHPVGRLGEADEIANVIAFLASDEACPADVTGGDFLLEPACADARTHGRLVTAVHATLAYHESPFAHLAVSVVPPRSG